jgi:hypothetical protein
VWAAHEATGNEGNEGADGRDDTVMWEARAAADRLPDLLRWVESTMLPALAGAPDPPQIDVYSSTDERVVVIVRFVGAVRRLPEPPADLLRRPPHQWPFRHQ